MNTVVEEGKAVSRSVALLKPTWEKVDRIVDDEFTGNRSAYFAQLVRRDFTGRGITDKRHELLAKVGELADRLGADAVEAKLNELVAQQLELAGREGARP